MNERRRGSRYPVQDVTGTLLFHTEARILNLSISGLAVECTSPLRIGRTYTAKLQRGDHKLELKGKVMWCRLRSTRKAASGEVVPVYTAGIEFEGVLNEQARKLIRFLQKSAVISLETRINGRFQVEGEGAVALDASHDFQVKVLSTTGMLVVTDLAPEVGTVFTLELHLDGSSLRTRGRVAYVEPAGVDPSGSTHQLGIEFEGLSPEGRKAVEAFIGQQIHEQS